MENKSGLHPTGKMVLVLLDEVPTKSGLVELAESTIQKDQMAQIHGTLIEVGPLAWTDNQDKLTQEQMAQRRVPVGSAVVIKRYAGEYMTGIDKVKYRVINDIDIWATRDFNLPS